MTFEAKTMVPLPCDPEAAHTTFEDAASGSMTLLEAPTGYALTEGLALAFSDLDRHPLWLRLGPEDSDPATFLLSLVTAARRLHRDAGQATLKLMKEQPGPVFGWSGLYAQLAQDLRVCLPPRGALVLEDIDHASADSPTLTLVGRHLLPGLAGAGPCVLVSHGKPHPVAFEQCRQRSASELRLSESTVRRTLETWAPELTSRGRNRAMRLVGGRAALLAGLRELASSADRGLEPLLERVASREELATATAEVLLAGSDREARRVLGLALRIEYAHPAMTSAIGGEGQLPAGPWLQPLEDGWVRVRPCWRQPLRAVLGERAIPGRDALHQSADWLLDAGACEQAVVLYLEIGDHDCAARAIASWAGALMDLGQWATVDRWLARLPDEIFAAYPDLNSSRADIAAVRGDMTLARRWYDCAAAHYAKRNDLEGQCRSMLAGSAVAAEAGDLANALSRAHAASSLAGREDLSGIRMWALWQVGRVSLAAGDNEGALSAFSRAGSAAAAADDLTAARPVRMTGELASQVRELRRRQESHREAHVALSLAEHEALNELAAAARTPEPSDDGLFGTDGWSRTPVPLKLAGLIQSGAPPPVSRSRSLSWLRRVLLPYRQDPPGQRLQPAQPPGRILLAGHPESGPFPDREPFPSGGHPPARNHAAGALSVVQAAPELAVHLLGSLHAAVDDVAVEDWPSARCRSLFGYLLTHREPWPQREVLMEVFWPGSAPEASRNSLNVAIHALRRTLRAMTDIPVIVYAGGAYRISRELRLWLDVDEFGRCVETGRRLEDAGEIDQATRDYEFAGGLYRGDFLADDPYEDWAALIRERLRLAHLDALGRLSNLYFNAGHYTACATLCQRIIESDPCREDAHRRLMRCYSRQGQAHLALMQYRMCARALAEELGVETDPATAELHEHIRRHERV
ncbi:MAG TPA: BTAD domain-containing putative transcriptional regulator [Streptosporangiaceae bacterium]|jgi:DNA-binding SARP family transcriptional activator